VWRGVLRDHGIDIDDRIGGISKSIPNGRSFFELAENQIQISSETTFLKTLLLPKGTCRLCYDSSPPLCMEIRKAITLVALSH
jgi:hypothetical protein